MPFTAQWSGTAHAPDSARKIGERPTFVKPLVECDQLSLTMQASQFILSIEYRVDPIPNGTAVLKQLTDYIALVRIAFTKRMVAPSLKFMLDNAAARTLPYVKWTAVSSAQDVDVIFSCLRRKEGLNSRAISLKLHHFTTG